MRTGKYNIALNFYAIIGFVLAALGQPLFCGILLGFAAILEKDRWLNVQLIQALMLSVIGGLVALVVAPVAFLGFIPFLGGIFTGFTALVVEFVGIVVVILAVVAILRVLKGEDAGIPLLQAFANKMCKEE